MPPYTISVQHLESVPLAVLRRQVAASEISRVVPECCGLVWNVLRQQHIKGGRHAAIYWDESIRLEVGAEIGSPFDGSGDVVRSATPAGTVAWTTHFGPYGGLGGAHEAIQKWSREQNRQLAGPKWEIYGHWLPEWDANPSQIRTDVYYLLSEKL
jgi:effector-binding domain-containing protein